MSKELQILTTASWLLFNQVGLAPNTDRLAAAGIRFLTTVCKSVHSKLFGEEATLKNIVESIVIPNLQVCLLLEDLLEDPLAVLCTEHFCSA